MQDAKRQVEIKLTEEETARAETRRNLETVRDRYSVAIKDRDRAETLSLTERQEVARLQSIIHTGQSAVRQLQGERDSLRITLDSSLAELAQKNDRIRALEDTLASVQVTQGHSTYSIGPNNPQTTPTSAQPMDTVGLCRSMTEAHITQPSTGIPASGHSIAGSGQQAQLATPQLASHMSVGPTPPHVPPPFTAISPVSPLHQTAPPNVGMLSSQTVNPLVFEQQQAPQESSGQQGVTTSGTEQGSTAAQVNVPLSPSIQ